MPKFTIVLSDAESAVLSRIAKAHGGSAADWIRGQLAAEGDRFPHDACHVCGRRIVNNDGYVVGANFAEWIAQQVRWLREDRSLDDRTAAKTALAGEHGALMRAVAAVYCAPSHAEMLIGLMPNHAPGRSSSRYAQHIGRMFAMSAEEQVAMLANAPPADNIYVVAHGNCCPEGVLPTYEIELSRINTPAKALAWTEHMAGKSSYNFRSWLAVLTHLFGPRIESVG